MKNNTIPRLREKVRTVKECCFTREELEILFSALPKQDWSVSPRIVITCTLPINLLERVRKLAREEKIENSSSFFRSCLSSYLQEKEVPPLPDDRGKEKSDYTFHIDKQLWNVWQAIPKGDRVFVLESWGWFLLGRLEGS